MSMGPELFLLMVGTVLVGVAGIALVVWVVLALLARDRRRRADENDRRLP